MGNSLRPAAGEVLIELLDDGPDDFGRSRFCISWPENNHWRGGSGTSGQVQDSSLEDCLNRWHARRPGDHIIIVDNGDRIHR